MQKNEFTLRTRRRKLVSWAKSALELEKLAPLWLCHVVNKNRVVVCFVCARSGEGKGWEKVKKVTSKKSVGVNSKSRRHFPLLCCWCSFDSYKNSSFTSSFSVSFRSFLPQTWFRRFQVDFVFWNELLLVTQKIIEISFWDSSHFSFSHHHHFIRALCDSCFCQHPWEEVDRAWRTRYVFRVLHDDEILVITMHTSGVDRYCGGKEWKCKYLIKKESLF